MATLPEASVDAIVCDPPYELTSKRPGGRSEATRGAVMGGFMGMKWDGTGVAFDPETWRQALRVLKPGGHLLAFGGSRTFHRMACAIEDAGFELRDTVLRMHEGGNSYEVQSEDCGWLMAWGFGSGFPKSLDVSRAIDKAAGAERKVIGKRQFADGTFSRDGAVMGQHGVFGAAQGSPMMTAPSTEEAKQWQGWGTALKPAYEPIVMARKPLSGTVASNVLTHGTGALNIDACRVPIDDEADASQLRTMQRSQREGEDGWGMSTTSADVSQVVRPEGRWPANLLHDNSDEVVALFPQSDGQVAAVGPERGAVNAYSDYGPREKFLPRCDSGSAARYFWCPKTSRTDRNDGLRGMEERMPHPPSGDGRAWDIAGSNSKPRANHHPTVKPTELMRYLCRLVTPPGGTVLDCFMGSGSTLKAAELEGFNAIGIEISAEYIEIARRRIASDAPLFANVS